MGLFSKFGKKGAADRLESEAIHLETEGDYAGAAADYAKEAGLELAATNNELIFADDCTSAFKDYLKVGDIENALGQARRALQGYELGDWLDTDHDDDYLNDLTNMVADMREAGQPMEADAFLADVNAALAKLGRAPLMVSVVAGEHRFPGACPHCGAVIHATGVDSKMFCPFCGGEIEAIG